MKGCGKRFTHKFWGERTCGQFEDLKHSDHYIYCEDCSEKNEDTNIQHVKSEGKKDNLTKA